MYELSIERDFSATHALTLRGTREPPHSHVFRVTVVIAGPDLDDDGVLCDFHDIERCLDEVIAPFRNAHLNDVPPFDQINPTAERIAQHLARKIGESIPPQCRLRSVTLTEAPGCAATYRPDL